MTEALACRAMQPCEAVPPHTEHPARPPIAPPLARRLQSLSLLFLSFVVAIHATTFFADGPAEADASALIALQVQASVAFGVARIAVPGFFLISGYLFFRTVATPADIVAKLRRRFGSLLVPYLAWSALTLGLLFAASLLPFSDAGVAAFSQHRPSDGFQLFRVLILDPVPGQLWFVRDLIVLTALAPLFDRLLRWTGMAVPLLLLVLWIAVPEHVVIENRHPLQIVSWTGLFFFPAGGWLGFRAARWLETAGPVSRSLAVALLTGWGAIVLIRLNLSWDAWVDRLLDRTGILVGLAAVWANYPRWGSLFEAPLVAWLAPFGFFIYAAHYPLTRVVVAAALKLTGVSGAAQLLVYFAAIPVVLTICGLAALGVRRFCPPLFGLFNGFRAT